MLEDEKINMLAKLARAPKISTAEGTPEGSPETSILTLAAASWGSRPIEEATIPTGFDPAAAALFESIVEGAYLVATADGVFDAEERRAFERIVSVACGGAVPVKHVVDLVSDLQDQLAEDGLEQRILRIGRALHRREHAHEVLRIAALIAQVSEDVSAIERTVLERITEACALPPEALDDALREVRAMLALEAASAPAAPGA